MRVERLRETPRVTKPYSDAQWQAILAAGAAVDARLTAGDVRLSMGGEPTFVALDDMAAPEWNIAALGPTKRDFADKLARRLRARFAPGGLLHYGQGKWYPGEQRRAGPSRIYWRTRRQAAVARSALIAEETRRDAGDHRRRREVCCASCAAARGSPATARFPAYEDAAHFTLAEQKLPLGVAPEDNKLDDPAERERLMRVFDHGLTSRSGYVLPLLGDRRTQSGKRRFITERWAFRRGQLFLVPGDSPLGLRLPLAGLPRSASIDYPARPARRSVRRLPRCLAGAARRW